MAINKKLIHFKKYETFNGSQGINGATEPTNGMYGNIPEHSIVFILDVKKIWTHGQLYDCDLSALENYLPKSGGSLTGDLYVGNVKLYNGDEDWNGGIDLVLGTIEASEVNDFSYVQDSQGNNLLEVLDTKAETYTITDFTAYDIDSIYSGNYTLTINPNPLEDAIRNNKIILIQREEDWYASPVLDAYVEDAIYLTVIYDSKIYSVTIELDLTTLTSSSIKCIYSKNDLLATNITVDNKLNIKDALTITKDENDNALMQISENLYFDNYVGWNSGDGVQHYINAFGDAYLTDLRTNKFEIDNALTITKDDDDYAYLNISEGLTIDNLVEWTDGSDTTASINYDGSASFTNLSVAGKNVTSFLTHHNSDINVVRSLTNIPTDKAVVFAYINSSQELTFNDANLVSGRGVHVFIYNYLTHAITVILPSVGNSTYICDNTTEFEVSSESIAEVNMIYLSSYESGSLKFIRSITV